MATQIAAMHIENFTHRFRYAVVAEIVTGLIRFAPKISICHEI